MLTGLIDKSIDRTSSFGLSGSKLRSTITIIACIGFSLFGYDQGVMGSIISSSQFNYEFPGTKQNGSDDSHATVIQGAVVSCYEIGCFFGALFAMLRGEKYGRKPMIIIGASIIIVGTVISVTAFRDSWGTGQFVIGRVITGIGNGMNTATIPVWQSEMSKPENRGRLVYIEGSTVAFGTFIAYWLDFGIGYVDTSVSWRFPIAFQIFFAGILMFGAISLPDSPRWLISKKRNNEAQEILAKLDDLDINDDFIISEMTLISETVERFNGQGSYKDLFKPNKTSDLARVLIGSSTQFFQQFTGCNAAIYYSTVLFENSIGLSHKLASILGGVFSTIYFLASIPAYFMVDSVGRRKLFLVGASGQSVAFLITFACLVQDTKANAKGAAVGLFLFIAFFGCTILQLPWVYPPEINQPSKRAVGSSISTATNWLCNFAVVMFTPLFVNNTRWGCYLFFAIMNMIWIPIIFFFYPETAGRSLEEVDIIYAKAKLDKAWPFRVAQNLPKLTMNEIKEHVEDLGIYDDEKQIEEKVDLASSNSGSQAEVAKDALINNNAN
ncbi:glucose-inactivated glycerol proton symporter [Saccharomycopsis crataegensis]|uniref:Glucose-inactivated glycerol proton symporter n=1 Tax=Saccharomycopsis crataegensis TaxID=43959 RepID=A0AAV5QGJ2_9ASCO|nr:glucose-inactivated glycerol proton symporter [Saccharomycopsis crataegensis]